MANLSDKLKNGIVVDKDMVVVCYDFNGNIDKVQKIEYMSNKVYQTILLGQKNELEKKALVEANQVKFKEEQDRKEKKKALKQNTLSAFDRWYRDVTNGIVLFDNSMYEDVINWYREYLNDNNIEIHEELLKYL